VSLNIEVKADVAGLRALAAWFGTGSEAIHAAGTAAIRARTNAELDWHGSSGEAFQGVMSRAGTGIDDVSTDMASAKNAVSVFADDMATVESRMRQARDVASAAGLQVTKTEIKEPGQGPAAPTPLPAGGSATPAQQEAFTAAQAAVADHQAKVNAYHQAAEIVADARTKQNAALDLLSKFGREQLNKAPFTFADISTGLAAEVLRRTSKFRAQAAAYGRYADRALRIAMSKPVPSAAFTQAAMLHAKFITNQSKYLDDAVRSLPAKSLDKLPDWAKKGLIRNVDDFAFKGGSAAARVGKAVLGKIPLVGIPITAASTTADIMQGKNPVQSVASGVSGLAAGAAVGAAIGGPLGLVVGAGVGAGVSFIVDEWGDEIAKGVGEAGKAVGNAVAEGAKKVGKFVGDLF